MSSKSKTMQAALNKAKQISKRLTAYDFSTSRCVRVVGENGHDMTFQSAFVLHYGGWLLVFCEHSQPFVFDKNLVNTIYEFSTHWDAKQFAEADSYIPRNPPAGCVPKTRRYQQKEV